MDSRKRYKNTYNFLPNLRSKDVVFSIFRKEEEGRGEGVWVRKKIIKKPKAIMLMIKLIRIYKLSSLKPDAAHPLYTHYLQISCAHPHALFTVEI